MLKFTDDHEWIRVEGSIGTVGITDFAQDALGDIVFVELPEVGRQVAVGDEAAVIESVKAAGEVKSPVSGEVISRICSILLRNRTVGSIRCSSPIPLSWTV